MKKSKFKIYGALALALTTSAVIAQPANEFFLQSLPQSSYLNPGMEHQETFHMNFPAFFMAGQTTVTGTLPGFTFSDIATTVDTTTTISLPAMLPLLGDDNYLNLNFQKEFLTYGWIKGKNYWSFNIGLTFNADINFNKNFAEFLIDGPAVDFLPESTVTPTGEPVSLDGSKYNVTSFMEYGIGFSRNVNEKLRLGGRLRLLSGAMNYSGSLDGVNITTATNLSTLTINSAIEAQSTSPLAFDEVVAAGDTTNEFNQAETQSNFISGLTGFKNAGIAFDFGGSYKINDQLTAFASIRDLGMISWGEGSKFANKADASFTFDGFTVVQLQDSAFFDNFGDSIVDILKLEETTESYTTYLPTRFFIGGEYSINPKFKANALYSGKIANGQLNNTIVAGIGWIPSKSFETRLSYTIKNNTYNNVGFAAILSMGAWQLYFITDNIIGLTAVDYANNVNVSFGSNLSFGRAKYFDKKDEGGRVKKTGDEGVKTDSTSANPKMKPGLAPENSVKENVDALDKAQDKADKKVDKAKDDAKEDVKDAAKDAKKAEKKAENEATKDADKAEKKAEKAIEAAEEKMEEADAKVKAAEEAAKQAKKEAADAQEKAAASTPVIEATPATVPAAAPASKEVSAPADSSSKPVTPEVSVDSLLIKPAAKKVETEVAPKVDATTKDIKSNEGVESLDKTIDVLNQKGENKGNDVPADVK